MNDLSLPNPREILEYKPNATIQQAFLEQAQKTPESTALSASHGQCSYAQLETISRQLAGAILANVVKTTDRIMILSDRNPALIYAVLAALRSGITYTIADASYPTARILSIREIIQPTLLIVCGAQIVPEEFQVASQLNELKILQLPEDYKSAHIAYAQYDQALPKLELDLTRTAYITFTSGSTGQPKGIATNHPPLPHFIDWHVQHHGFTANDHFSMLSGLSHDPLLRDIFTPLSIGATLHIPKQATIFDPDKLFEWLDTNNITVSHLTPAMGEIIVAGASNPESILKYQRYFFWGGDVLSHKTSKRLREIAPHAQQVNFYGTTETPQAMASFVITPDWQGPYPIGRGIKDTQLLVLNAEGELASVDEPGDLIIRSPYLSQGYINDEEQTESKFTTNKFTGSTNDYCYHTGDIGKYLPDGNVVYLGRSDNQIKIRGFRVEPSEITNVMEKFTGITRALVLAKNIGEDRKILVGYYVSAQNQDIDHNKLLNHLRTSLPSYMVPSHLMSLPAFPLLANGKIDLQSIPEPEMHEPSSGENYIAPCNEREVELVKIWQDILGIATIGVNDNFLALGGDSLSALKALGRMKQLGIPNAVARGIFQGKTIREIVGEDNGDEIQTNNILPEWRTNLLINILRGILVIIVVSDHWSEGFINRLFGKGNGSNILEALSPIFNIATPGFAYVFGTGLGYFFYTKYHINKKQTRKSMQFGAILILIGIMIGSFLNLGSIPFEEITPTVFFNAFFGPLLYYALAMLTASIWFCLIGLSRYTYLNCVLLIIFCYFIFHGCEYLLLDREQTGFLQLIRLMLVAKFNYFNMSIGAIGGVMTGIYLRRHCAENLSIKALLAGITSAVTGVALLYLNSGSFEGLHQQTDMGLWRWLFYSGVVLMTASFIFSLVNSFTLLPKFIRIILQVLAVFGQATFLIIALHSMVLYGKAILTIAGLPISMAISIPVLIFLSINGWVMVRLYQLYYSDAY